MEYPEDEELQRCLIEAAMTAAAFLIVDVWRRYYENGGHVGLFETEAYLHGLLRLPVQECDLLAQAVNELIDEEPPLPRAPYRDPRFRPVNTSSEARYKLPTDQTRQWLWRFPGSIPD